MKTYRIGLIGFGYIGKVHAFAHWNMPYFIGNLPFKTEFVKVCTGHSESAAKAGEFLHAQGVTDYRQITEDPTIDVVHICTPNHLHKEAVLSAMAHGKHVYCDKPMTATLDEALEIEQALKTYAGIGQMTFQLRFFPATLRAKQMIDDGFLGRPLQFRCSFLHSGNIDQVSPKKWRFDKSAGGGVSADLGSHALDLLMYWLGDIKRLTATMQFAVTERRSLTDPEVMLPVDADDAMISLVELENGAMGTVEASKLATGAEDELRLEVHGTKGALRFNLMDPHHLEAYDVRADSSSLGGVRGWTRIDTGQRYGGDAAFPAPKSTIGWLRAHVQCLYHFMDCVHRGVPSVPGLEQGIRIQRLLDAIERSSKSGEWVTP